MGSVVSFPDKGQGPHLSGPVRCVRCKHEWEGVSPVGVFEGLECPACGNDTGVRYCLTGPEDAYWQCNCGSATFTLPRTGAPVCCNCGLRATGWVNS